MNNIEKSRAVRIGEWIAQSPSCQWVIEKHLSKALFLFLLFTHSIYWLTAWWSPLPFLLFSAVGVYIGGGVLKPWKDILNQGLKSEYYDLGILKIAIPFIALNWVAIFACLYMYGVVLENNEPITGTWKHFYFSATTLATVGYGNIVPGNTVSEIIAVVESLTGVLGFAFIVGIVMSIIIKRTE